MKKDQQAHTKRRRTRNGGLLFLFEESGGAAVEGRGQVRGMVLIKRYEVLKGGLPESLHVLNSGRQSTLNPLVPQRRKARDTEWEKQIELRSRFSDNVLISLADLKQGGWKKRTPCLLSDEECSRRNESNYKYPYYRFVPSGSERPTSWVRELHHHVVIGWQI